MRVALSVLFTVHGALHLIGFVQAFGLAELSRVHQPTTRVVGGLWLLAGLAFVASGILLFFARRHYWVLAVPAVVLSQTLIIASWSDAKFGTIANLVALIPLTVSLLDLRPSSLHSIYDREVRRGVARVAGTPTVAVSEADLAPLPAPVQTYLRRAGVVGKPRVRNFHAVFRADMRPKPDAKWMSALVEQVNFYDEPARLFFMQASRSGIPIDVFHSYVGPAATMQVRIAGLFEVVDARGPELTQSETVTMLNDMCVLAPAALIGPAVTWQLLDARRAKATFSNAGRTVSAELSFDANGDLVGFVSNDRYQSDGKTHRLFPWSTPLGGYRDFGGVRLAAEGEARWREPSGDWTYGRFVLQRIAYNVGAE